MLQTNTSAKPEPAIKTSVIAPEQKSPPTFTSVREPHPVFGQMPDGFKIEDQPIETLAFWHKRSMTYVDRLLVEGCSDEKMHEVMLVNDEIYHALLRTKTNRPSAVASQMRAVVADMEFRKSDEIEETLDAADFRLLTENLTEATAPLRPKKKVGALSRGRKLTRAGLLTRYQSFLVQELETVSYHLYGVRDYGKQIVMYDDAVSDGMRDKSGRVYPFFNEPKLPARAKAVLKSLKIDTERDDRLLRNGGPR
jgi:hypothetical protein